MYAAYTGACSPIYGYNAAGVPVGRLGLPVCSLTRLGLSSFGF